MFKKVLLVALSSAYLFGNDFWQVDFHQGTSIYNIENTKKEEEIRKIQHTPDDGKGIFDHLGDLFGGFGSLIGLGGLGGLLGGKLGSLVKTMKDGISKNRNCLLYRVGK